MDPPCEICGMLMTELFQHGYSDMCSKCLIKHPSICTVKKGNHCPICAAAACPNDDILHDDFGGCLSCDFPL